MQGFDAGAFLAYLQNVFLIGGVGVTVGLTVAALAGGMVLGMGLAQLRMSSMPVLQGFARGYLWFFRGTPLLIQMVIIFTGLPQIGIRLGVVPSALLALILNETAYLSEIIRSGFLGVPQTQREAARALGLRRFAVVWCVVLPQAFRLMLPPLGNSINGLLKATSITSVISMEELMRRSSMLMQERFEVLEVFAAAAVWYLLLTSLWDVVQRRLERAFGYERKGTDAALPQAEMR